MAEPFTLSLSLSLGRASILQRIKETYLLWLEISPHMPKGARFSMGARIENKFIDLLELSYIAYFSPKETKLKKVLECILILDVLKFLVATSWEGKLISNHQCQNLALKLEEIGRMFGGWQNNLKNPQKKNRDL